MRGQKFDLHPTAASHALKSKGLNSAQHAEEAWKHGFAPPNPSRCASIALVGHHSRDLGGFITRIDFVRRRTRV